jgi:hypothetical protein
VPHLGEGVELGSGEFDADAVRVASCDLDWLSVGTCDALGDPACDPVTDAEGVCEGVGVGVSVCDGVPEGDAA